VPALANHADCFNKSVQYVCMICMYECECWVGRVVFKLYCSTSSRICNIT